MSHKAIIVNVSESWPHGQIFIDQNVKPEGSRHTKDLKFQDFKEEIQSFYGSFTAYFPRAFS